MKKILAILISALVLVFAAVPAFADVAAPQRQFNCVCGRSFTSEKKWSQHKQKCYVEVETTAEETSSAVETTVDTTAETTEATSAQIAEPSTTVATTTAIPTTEAKTETTTAATTQQDVTEVKKETLPAKVPAMVVVTTPEETTAEEITTTAATTVVSTEKERTVITSTTSPSSLFGISIPAIKFPRIEFGFDEEKPSISQAVWSEANAGDNDVFYEIIEKDIPNTGSSHYVVAAFALAIVAGGTILALKKNKKSA